MAVPPDDDDDAWEDEDAQLQGLGTTTHRSRNPHKAVIARRGKRRSRVVGAKRSADEEAARGLAADLDKWQEESEERAQELSETYGMKLKEVRRRMQATSGFKDRRKVSLYNAKISALMAQLNEDRDVGHRYLMTDIKRMVKEDPSMLDGFTRGGGGDGGRHPADAKRTVERLMEEITGLAERSGMIGFAMFTRGHVHDSSIPVTIESWGALSFFREVLKRDPADVSALFELWGVTRARGNTGAETLLSMQKECTEMIKQAYGVDFKRMSKQSAIGPLRTLRDALKAGTCRWAVLTASQKKQLLSEFKKMRTGEPLSDDDGDKRAGEEEEEEEEVGSVDDDEERPHHSQHGDVGRREGAASSKGKRGDKASKSTKATGKRKRRENDNDAPTRKPSGKRKRCADDDSGSDNDDRPAPKAAGSASAAPPTTTTTGTRTETDDDDARPKKEAQEGREDRPPPREDNNARAANQQKTSATSASKGGGRDGALSGSRPKPKPLYKGALTDGGSTSPRALAPDPPHAAPLCSRSVSPSGTTAAPVHPLPKSPSPSASRHGSAADGATATSSAAPRGRANVVRGRRGGPPGLRAVL
ncbi:hypothetical protein B0H14DRAFT_3525487 [Mycena olivaceomarginata]|nr:hypothetical protein B0H14DRAFT_3525487 [Mycena olivaceomarginata]